MTELPDITRLETGAIVDDQPAIEIEFGNEAELRYVWDGDTIREQTYHDGVVHDERQVGGDRENLGDVALESLQQYINEFKHDPQWCKLEWPHVYELLTETVRESDQ